MSSFFPPSYGKYVVAMSANSPFRLRLLHISRIGDEAVDALNIDVGEWNSTGIPTNIGFKIAYHKHDRNCSSESKINMAF
jgi:hypothetical protein